MADPGPTPPTLGASLKRLFRTVVSVLENRFELLLVELAEEQHRLFEALLLAAAAAVFGLLTLIVATAAVVILCGPDHLLAALTGVCLVYGVATTLLVWRLRVRLRHWTPFSATLTELKKDKACLEEPS